LRYQKDQDADSSKLQLQDMQYDALIIGAGLSGLTAASLLAKRGLHVGVLEHGDTPGGSCGIFKRQGATFDQGSSMLYGFGEQGFNAHRFVMNCLEEPIDVIRHETLYTVHYQGRAIRFWPDVNRFVEELSEVFPTERVAIRRFYTDMGKLYQHVMAETPNYTSPDETDPIAGGKGFIRHPLSYLRFLSYLNISAHRLLARYFHNPEIFHFFDKLTSTYCYATVQEAPAILAAVMFVDNHVGGSYYPAGSTLFLPGKLEKVIEEHGGEIRYGCTVKEILFEHGKAISVCAQDGSIYRAQDVVYSGTVWNLYGSLIPVHETSEARRHWAQSQKPTYPSVVLYALVDRDRIPSDTQPVEMLVGNPASIDESEVTAYIPSLDDPSICAADEHVIEAIGPSFGIWENLTGEAYHQRKTEERDRLLAILARRFPGIENHARYTEVATPRTIERYCLKNGGAVAGPKQMLGQHMFKRLHIRTQCRNLYCCGESTVMGTGTPTVTTSGLSAANAVLKSHGLQPFTYQPSQKNYVRVLAPNPKPEDVYPQLEPMLRALMDQANACQFCEKPRCLDRKVLDVPAILRRVAVGNVAGAKRVMGSLPDHALLESAESRCIENTRINKPVPIRQILQQLSQME